MSVLLRSQKVPAFIHLTSDKWFANVYSSGFYLHSGHRRNMEEETYPALDSPVYGEADGAKFVLVED